MSMDGFKGVVLRGKKENLAKFGGRIIIFQFQSHGPGPLIGTGPMG